MKKNILLTTTAMLLSAITLNANADSNSATLMVNASFVKPFQLASEQYLGFGLILADEGGKKVVVTTDGKLGAGSDATMMSTASFKNYSDSVVAYSSFNEGLIRAKGFLDNDYDGTFVFPINDDVANLIASVSFSDTSLDLKSQTDSVTCGTVTGFNSKITIEGEDLLIHVGGTLTTANLSGQSRSVVCVGYTTVTLVYNDENFANAMNSLHNGQ